MNLCPAIKNAPNILGVEIQRDFDRRIILIRVEKKIKELVFKFPEVKGRNRNVPMPKSGFLVRDWEFDELSEADKKALTLAEVQAYMSIVGALIWIQGVRLDILFAVLYLSW